MITNTIAFGSAPRRAADSQPISQLVGQAGRQTEAHSLGFFSGRLGFKQCSLPPPPRLLGKRRATKNKRCRHKGI